MNDRLKKYLGLFAMAAGCLLTARAAADIDVMTHPDKADTAKQCAICHYRWVYTFYVEHQGTFLAPLEEKKVVGKKQMCFSCHDGSVRDSRDRICNDPGHRVGNIPSPRVRIPEIFPLDQDGRMTCSTCHTPHGIAQKGAPLKSFYLRSPNVNSSFCRECHFTKMGGKQQGNHPTDVSAEDIPQEIIDAGGRFGTEMPNQIICETCHSPHGGVDNRFLVLSAESPKTRSVLCEVCHTKTPGLTGDPTHHKNSHPYDLTPGKIPRIPATWSDGVPVVLGTGGELVCRTCHIPHAAADKDMLLAEPNVKDSLCVQCHSDHKHIVSSSHYQHLIAPDEKNIRGQRAAESGPCSPCHLVHHGTGDLMWARTADHIQISGKPGEYCTSCHWPGGAAENFMPGDFSHPLDITLPDSMSGVQLPLFDDQGENPQGEIRCATCHNFHNPLPAFAVPGQDDVTRTQYLRFSDEGASGVCVRCHARQGLVRGTDHDLTITAPDFKNTSGLLPGHGGICSPCHAVHNARHRKFLWSAPLGTAHQEGWNLAYAADESIMPGLCTGCHAPGNSAEGKIPQFGLHPRDFLVPQGELPVASSARPLRIADDAFPLYSDEGERIDTGNIVCSTCHNPHQWAPNSEANGPGRAIEGNVTNSFLRPGLDSQFCARCHGNESLVKFHYFHRATGRLKTKPAFSFKK